MISLTVTRMLSMPFPERVVALRKKAGLTQQALADAIGVNVSQLKRYEAGTSQPTLDVLRRLAIALHVSADVLLFEADERGPGDDLRLQFEAIERLAPEERRVIKELIEGMIIKYESGRWHAGKFSGEKKEPAKAG